MLTISAFVRVLLIAGMGVFSLATWADEIQSVCTKNRRELKHKAGVYMHRELLELATKTRLWQYPNSEPSAIEINKKGEGKIIYQWHESMGFDELQSEECMKFERTTLKYAERNKKDIEYQLIPAGSTPHAEVFRRIFNGCYTDQNQRKWCFSPGKIQIGKQHYPAQIMLDLSELREDANNLKVKTEKLFWIFKPDGDGWLVLKSDWTSGANFKEPDWSNPWMRLSRQ